MGRKNTTKTAIPYPTVMQTTPTRSARRFGVMEVTHRMSRDERVLASLLVFWGAVTSEMAGLTAPCVSTAEITASCVSIGAILADLAASLSLRCSTGDAAASWSCLRALIDMCEEDSEPAT